MVEKAVGLIREKHERPYFMWLNPINPHDICHFAINKLRFGATLDDKLTRRLPRLADAMKWPEGVSEKEFLEKYCPLLPANYEPQQDEPLSIGMLLENRSFRLSARQEYTENDWRQHRWAYCRLVELIDRQIQTVLNAVKESGQEENTMIIFSSDHGDMDSSHRMEHKSVLYEESANVPFLVMWKNHIAPGRVDSTHLVSSGLDLLPTVCDYADIHGIADPRGRSLRPLLEGKSVEWRKTLGVESEVGRMVVDADGCKYIRYNLISEQIEEQLLDRKADPGEMRHFTKDASHASKLEELRNAYQTEWFPLESSQVKGPKDDGDTDTPARKNAKRAKRSK